VVHATALGDRADATAEAAARVVSELDTAIRETIRNDLSLRAAGKRQGWTSPTELAREVLAQRELAWAIERLPLGQDDKYGLRDLIKSYVRERVAHFMRKTRDEFGIRRYETVRVPDRQEARWLPVMGMTIKQTRESGEAKIKQGKSLYREGALLERIADIGEQMGLGLNDVIGVKYTQIATQAALAIEQEKSDAA
jgi:hypothetical protein